MPIIPLPNINIIYSLFSLLWLCNTFTALLCSKLELFYFQHNSLFNGANSYFFPFLFNWKFLTNHINLIARYSEISCLDRLLFIPGISLSHYHCGHSFSYSCSIFHFLDPHILYTSSFLSLFSFWWCILSRSFCR